MDVGAAIVMYRPFLYNADAAFNVFKFNLLHTLSFLFHIHPFSCFNILSLPPFLFLRPPLPRTHTYPTAVMASIQQMQLAKPRASAEIHKHA